MGQTADLPAFWYDVAMVPSKRYPGSKVQAAVLDAGWAAMQARVWPYTARCRSRRRTHGYAGGGVQATPDFQSCRSPNAPPAENAARRIRTSQIANGGPEAGDTWPGGCNRAVRKDRGQISLPDAAILTV